MATRIVADRESIDDLLRHDQYTPEDLAEMTGMNIWTIRSAARTGELPAFIVDHHVLYIRREDAVHWLAKQLGH